MAKRRATKKKATKKKSAKKKAPAKKKTTRKVTKAKTMKRVVVKGKARAAVASVSSGSEASTLDPKGRLIVETEEEAVPRARKGDMSGDLQGLSTTAYDDSESVSELIEEGQDLEAELIEGVEDAPDADQGEVRVHEAPQREPEYKNRRRL